ncbi:MAG: hypothetical protein AB7W16_13620 [Candidatus Obscuribacterales bacterium]
MDDRIETCFMADYLNKLPAVEKPLNQYLEAGKTGKGTERFRDIAGRLEKDGILPLVLLIEMSTLDRNEDGELTRQELGYTLSADASWMARAAADYALDNFDRIGSREDRLSPGDLQTWSEKHRPTANNRYDFQDLDIYMLSGICKKFAPEPGHYRSLSEILEARKAIDYLWYKQGQNDRITPEFKKYAPELF